MCERRSVCLSAAEQRETNEHFPRALMWRFDCCCILLFWKIDQGKTQDISRRSYQLSCALIAPEETHDDDERQCLHIWRNKFHGEKHYHRRERGEASNINQTQLKRECAARAVADLMARCIFIELFYIFFSSVFQAFARPTPQQPHTISLVHYEKKKEVYSIWQEN